MKIGQHGAIVGRNEGKIEYCINNANIIQAPGAGGIAGNNYNIINECINNGNIRAVAHVGGINGNMYSNAILLSSNQKINTSNITACVNNGTVSATSSIVGGIVGYSEGNITGCKNTGNVTSEGNPENPTVSLGTGGIAGRVLNSTIILTSSNTGNIKATTSSFVGGIIGYVQSTTNGGGRVAQCYNYNGNICTAVNGVGGIIGRSDGFTINNCYNYFTSNEYYIKAEGVNAGGIIGTVALKTNINNCYNIGENIISTKNYGFIGSVDTNASDSIINNCYYLSTSALSDTGYAPAAVVKNITKKADSYFKLPVTNTTSVAYLLNGSSDTGVWGQDNSINGGYPYLINNIP